MINNLFQDIIDEITGQKPIYSDEFLTTGFESFDNILTGFQPGKFIIIGGRPAMGKTCLALNMFLKEAEKQIPVAYFSLDTNEYEIARKLISIIGNIPFNSFKRKNLSQRMQNGVIDCILDLQNMPFFIECDSQYNVKTLIDRITARVLNNAVKIIYVDNLQLLAYNDINQDHDRYGEVCIQLKKLAWELKVVIILMSGLNRRVENREGSLAKIPRICDLYGSAKIEELADIIMLVYRPAYYNIDCDSEGNDVKKDLIIYIVKHKNGPTGIAKLIFTKETFSLT